MPLGPGSGICCGYTTTRAILGDAVALVRGDRFYTTDYTRESHTLNKVGFVELNIHTLLAANLTAWGFQDCARDPNNGALGAALPKLLFRNLPRHYPADSIYGFYPFFTPTVNKSNLQKLGTDKMYTFDRPKAAPVPKVVDTMEGVKFVLGNTNTFKEQQWDEGVVLGADVSRYDLPFPPRRSTRPMMSIS